jgi:hypothetical protein
MPEMKADTAIEAAARYWQEFRKCIGELEGAPHPGANVLSFHRDQMVFARERLLKLGLDVADLRNPKPVPLLVSHHPKGQANALSSALYRRGICRVVDMDFRKFLTGGNPG